MQISELLVFAGAVRFAENNYIDSAAAFKNRLALARSKRCASGLLGIVHASTLIKSPADTSHLIAEKNKNQSRPQSRILNAFAMELFQFPLPLKVGKINMQVVVSHD